jgi:hypothetical protein
MCTYVLAAIVKKELALEISLSTLFSRFSPSSLLKKPLSCLFQALADKNTIPPTANQLTLL